MTTVDSILETRVFGTGKMHDILTGDGHIVAVSADIISNMKTVQNMLECIGDSKEAIPITANALEFKIAASFYANAYHLEPLEVTNSVGGDANNKELAKKRYFRILAKAEAANELFAQFDIGRSYRLINAANYLEAVDFLKVIAVSYAKQLEKIADETDAVEKTREILQEPDDLTPDEKLLISHEYSHCTEK